ncbi:MAG: BBP7 family outer membrane beta-barrel protein [Planctomycetota bacterium]
MTKHTFALLIAALIATAAGTGGADWAAAQGMPGQPGRFPVANAHYGAPMQGPMRQPQGPIHAFHPGDPLVDAHGDPAVIPAQYCPPGYGGGYGSAAQDAFGGMGYNVDQVGPHYFDISVEFLAYRRDQIFDSQINFTSLGFSDTGTAPNIVLDSNSLSTEFEPGFRVTGRYDIGPLSVLEFGYAGLFDMNDQASFTDPMAVPGNVAGLFSPFTNFGDGFLPETEIDPLEGGFNPMDLEEFEETDRATTHRISFTSDLQTAELSYRRYWVGYSPRITGTILAGFRYTKLKESFRFDSIGNDFVPPNTVQGAGPTVQPDGVGTATYQIVGDNDLTGFQLGGDMWLGVVQGLRVGTEGKVGIYNNHYTLGTTFDTSDGIPTVNEFTSNDQAAFIGEAKLQLVADLLPSLSFRGGYEVLFMNSLALIGQNFNPGSPFASDLIPPTAQRTPFILDQGNAFFHGWNVGFEYVY